MVIAPIIPHKDISGLNLLAARERDAPLFPAVTVARTVTTGWLFEPTVSNPEPQEIPVAIGAVPVPVEILDSTAILTPAEVGTPVGTVSPLRFGFIGPVPATTVTGLGRGVPLPVPLPPTPVAMVSALRVKLYV